MYIRLSDQFYPLSEQDIKAAEPNKSYTDPFNPEGYAVVFTTPQPTYDQYSQICIERQPRLTEKGTWEQVWEIIDLSGSDLASAQEQKLAKEALIEEARIASLWKGAYDYEFAQISGMAVGVLTIGVLQQKPKAVAISTWSKSIWDEYYMRKENGSTTTDYSFAGAMPYTVPELMLEVLR